MQGSSALPNIFEHFSDLCLFLVVVGSGPFLSAVVIAFCLNCKRDEACGCITPWRVRIRECAALVAGTVVVYILFAPRFFALFFAVLGFIVFLCTVLGSMLAYVKVRKEGDCGGKT